LQLISIAAHQRTRHLLHADVLWFNRRHLRFASVCAYTTAMDLKFWKKAFRELDAATTRTALDAAARKLLRAKAELKLLEAKASA
jgi:hypothetical protein